MKFFVCNELIYGGDLCVSRAAAHIEMATLRYLQEIEQHSYRFFEFTSNLSISSPDVKKIESYIKKN